jgi:hypothetical protein
VVVPASLLGNDVDYEVVYAAFTGFLPAFAKEAIDRALRYSLMRTAGAGDRITTADLVDAGNGLRHQLDLMTGAGDVPVTDSLADNVRQIVSKVVDSTKLMDNDGDEVYELAVNGKR